MSEAGSREAAAGPATAAGSAQAAGSAPAPAPAEIERTILALVDRRGPGKTICPSEAARALGGDDGFRVLMPAVRAVAGDLAARGELEITQKGAPVALDGVRGPIRLRRPVA